MTTRMQNPSAPQPGVVIRPARPGIAPPWWSSWQPVAARRRTTHVPLTGCSTRPRPGRGRSRPARGAGGRGLVWRHPDPSTCRWPSPVAHCRAHRRSRLSPPGHRSPPAAGRDRGRWSTPRGRPPQRRECPQCGVDRVTRLARLHGPGDRSVLRRHRVRRRRRRPADAANRCLLLPSRRRLVVLPGTLVTPPAVEEHFSRTTLNGLLCEDFTACPMNSSLHLDSCADRRSAGTRSAARDGNLATSRSPDDLCLLFRRGGTVQPGRPAHRRRKPLVSSPVRHMAQAGLTTGSTPDTSVPRHLGTRNPPISQHRSRTRRPFEGLSPRPTSGQPEGSDRGCDG